jgi:hypothetical protein
MGIVSLLRVKELARASTTFEERALRDLLREVVPDGRLL